MKSAKSFTILRAIIFLTFLVLASQLSFAQPPTGSICTRVASPSGSDSNSGTVSSPYKTAQRLINSLSAGQTGCLRAGVYAENVEIFAAGTANARITVRSYPSERATIRGTFDVRNGANFVIISYLDLDGRNAGNWVSPTIGANDVTFQFNDVTNYHQGPTCFLLGLSNGRRADRAVLWGNRIHDCGRLPATNLDHGIYVGASTGSIITSNFIYDNADFGVHLYPDAQNTTITDNVIDGNGKGIIFSGDGGIASNNNQVARNIITNSKIRWNVEYWYPAGNPIGTGNVVQGNCLQASNPETYYNTNGGVSDNVGFTTSNNIVVVTTNTSPDIIYIDRPGKDFRIQATSPCMPLFQKRWVPVSLTPDAPGPLPK